METSAYSDGKLVNPDSVTGLAGACICVGRETKRGENQRERERERESDQREIKFNVDL